MMASILIFLRRWDSNNPTFQVEFWDEIESVDLGSKDDVGIMPNFNQIETPSGVSEKICEWLSIV